MYKALKHLDDEHMRLYEWSGAGAGTTIRRTPENSTWTHAWHASYGILALLTWTPLLLLNGCDSQGPVDQASEQLDLAVKDLQSLQARPQIKRVSAHPDDTTIATPKPTQGGSMQSGK